MPRARIHPRARAGQKYGRYEVIHEAPRRNTQPYWLCRCTCGTEKEVSEFTLVTGLSKSCGCGRFGDMPGAQHTPEYWAWRTARQRCTNPNTRDFKRYGGRGIRMCKRWDKFSNFLDDMGFRPEGPERYTLDRINTNGPYSPENCRWATYRVQENNRRNTPFVMFKGRRIKLRDLADRYKIKHVLLYRRLAWGWPMQRALETPSEALRRRK
ncbi:MAG TPA: hypothetical protein VJ816_03180 [Gemmatimonadales bacterium]|nr:hypothetical protein [Gemmatimonadales bacterium]